MEEKTENLKSELFKWAENKIKPVDSAASSSKILAMAQELLKDSFRLPPELWHYYLDITRKSNFLRSLPGRQERYDWADTAFCAIGQSNYNFYTLFRDRVEQHPERILFKTADGNNIVDFSYKWVDKRTRQIAAVFYELSGTQPRVAIYSDNNLDGACCDLACLIYDIFDSPLNIHFGTDTLASVFSQINVNLVVTDTGQRLNLLLKLKEKYKLSFNVVYTGYEKIQENEDVFFLEKLISRQTPETIDSILSKRKPISLKDDATALFTSGSTGQAKGVAFSIYNLITKRFARAAALPEVGEKELLLCYLPLYHTFGRYLEMMGMIFWGGTYVFAGNPSIETLLNLMQKVNPTGIISIPLRLVQIRDNFMQQSARGIDKKMFRKLTGSSLRWGLSAAGFLDAKIFSFFHNHGVELCSGFGMTEATGGISMTPPGEYVKNSVGIPLPGINIRLNSKSELEISGHYVARYLDDNSSAPGYWLPTGDLFKQDKNGYLQIVDRIKDIYKNNKGQTIAPRHIEKIFENIPGFKHTFLCGDGLAYNTLLIVPDLSDPVLAKAASRKKLTDYFRPIVSSANRELAPYERIVDFTLLDRDFDENKGELTSKGTLRRKNIETNFAAEINKMYKYPNLEFRIDEIKVLVPRWIIRDLGITEYDIKSDESGLHNKINNSFLPVKYNYKNDRILIGDFEYIVASRVIDLGIFVRQPVLWVGNITLINFAFCKDGWDTHYDEISPQVFLNPNFIRRHELPVPDVDRLPQDTRIREFNELIIKAIFSRKESARQAVEKLEKSLHTESHRIDYLIRRRLESLALHPDFEIRSLAYRILLFDEPRLNYSRYLPAFINSGLPFLNKKSIQEISKADFETGRLESLRQRLESYRTTLVWTSSSVTITQFKRILELLVNFAKFDRRTYSAVREELVSWILHRKEPQLAAYAQDLFNKLSAWFESTFELTPFEADPRNWQERIVFQEGFSTEEIKRIQKVLCSSTFIKEAMLLIFNENNFHLKQVLTGGIWISRILSPHNSYLYHISLNTIFDKHYDLMLLMKEDITRSAVRETIYWMIKVSGYPGASSVLPRFGNFRSSLGAASLAFINELTVWDKIRDYSSTRTSNPSYKNEYKWRVLFVRSISAFFRAWHNSGFEIVPGSISPTNVVVPEADIKQNSRILSLSGWIPYKNSYSLVQPVITNFYLQTLGNYPWNKDVLKIEWIFDAAFEAFDTQFAHDFLQRMKSDLNGQPVIYENKNIASAIDEYLGKLKNEPYIYLPVLSAEESFKEWLESNPDSTSEAKDQFIRKLYTLYQLDRFPAIMRYIFYQNTYFADADEIIRQKLENLIKVMFLQPEVHATRLIELSELQDVLTDDFDRQVFSKIVFPDVFKPLQIELMPVGEDENKAIIVKTTIKDRKNASHIIRQALSPFEVGSLNRLFILDDYPVNITNEDQFLILTDIEEQEEVNGGICYKILDNNVAHLEGIVVAAPFRSKGLGGVMLEDFCSRLHAEGIKVITTHFYLTRFFGRYQFKVDKKWGGLVRFLTP